MEDDQAKQYFVPPPTSITTTAISSSTGRHPVYKGIRCRSGKWVTEIREPRKTKRIWLGTYPTPEMAAAAYDAAAFVLKGPDTPLNFPNHSYSSSLFQLLPNLSPTAVQIRAVAANAAASRAVVSDNMVGSSSPAHPHPNFGRVEEYVDEEELLDMPNLLTDMAKGMLISPPRLIAKSPSSDDPVEENLWSFRF